MKQNHPEVFRFHQNVATKHPDRKFINQMLFWNKKVPKDIAKTLELLRLQCYEVYKGLEPLVDLGIVFNMWLVGGSVRDLLLGNADKVKDLDIMVSFSDYFHPHYFPPKTFLKKTGFKFETEKLKSIIYRHSETEPFANWKNINKKSTNYKKNQEFTRKRTDAVFDMIASALGQKFELNEIYFPREKTSKDTESYLDLRLEGVIKINKDDWKWPADILVSTYNIDDFLSSFDIGVCKVGIEFVRASDLSQQRMIFPQTAEDLLKRVRFDASFLKDARKKELVIYISDGMVPNQLHHSCETHTPNVQKKYDWPFYIKYGDIKFHENFDWDKFLLEVAQKEEAAVQEAKKSGRRYKKKTDEMFDYIKCFFFNKKLQSTLSTKEDVGNKKLKKI